MESLLVWGYCNKKMVEPKVVKKEPSCKDTLILVESLSWCPEVVVKCVMMYL